ncbi:GAF domain-containing protein [bacterium]|nr:GAF domain-containing protein [bacterium]
MADIIKWPVVLVCPGEEELSLLAEVSARRDARLVAVADRTGSSLGAGLAEIMGVRVVKDLAELTPGSAAWLVHPPRNDEVAFFLDAAAEHGLETIGAREFAALLNGPRLAPEPDRRPTPAGATLDSLAEVVTTEDELLERETAAIHRTLSRIEEALDRESLLRWLLGLATRATGASSGSIMLFDDRSEELYVAFAYGLSQHTMHTTRVRLGEGIAGRVAQTRKAEFIGDNRHPGARRDRSAISQAICAPILWSGQVLGVVNVSTDAGEAALDRKALETIQSLTHRFGLILDRFLSLQLARDSELFRRIDRDLHRDTGHPQSVASTLCDWALDLQDVAGAELARLEVLTSDGDLFWAGPEETGYESPPPARKAEVLSSGRPAVLRPGDPDSPAASPLTIFHLPVGREPLRALLTLGFASPARAHQFHAVSAEIIYLINRHLTGFLDRAATADQVDRLTTLAAALSELARSAGAAGFRDRVLQAACRLTGASQALLLTGSDDTLPGGDGDDEDDDALRLEAVRLLTEAGRAGWQTTVLEVAGGALTRSLLVVPLDDRNPFPGLVLLDKRRLHPLDGAGFTEFDALFARRLLPLLHVPEEKRPAISEADTEAIVDRLEPAAAPALAGLTRDTLAGILQREMDRCDRYHTMLGLAAFRLESDAGLGPADVVAIIDRRLRSTDHTGCLQDGTILVIVPEDIQSLARLQHRVTEVLRQATGLADLTVRSATRVYPGGGETPEALIANVLDALAD